MASDGASRGFRRLGAMTLLVVAATMAAGASVAAATPRGAHVTFAAPSKKHKTKKKAKAKAKVATLAAAAAWLTLGPDAKLIAQGAPQQLTDTSSPFVQQITSLTSGLSFQGLAQANYARTPDPTVTGVPVGNYILKLVVFGTAADAQKFRTADAAQVTGGGKLKQVDTVADGVVLDDSQGHVNGMFTINNVAVDLRIGVSESAPGDGVKEIKALADMIQANAKKS
jgi:hypothetical protein